MKCSYLNTVQHKVKISAHALTETTEPGQCNVRLRDEYVLHYGEANSARQGAGIHNIFDSGK